MNSNVTTMVLSAGESKRLGRHKGLLMLDGESMIRHVTRTSLSANVDQVVVVLGAEAETLNVEISDLRAKVVVNTNYKLGRMSSVKVGLEFVLGEKKCRAVILWPVDCPRVPADVLNRLIDCYYQNADRSQNLWIVPEHAADGEASPKRGHPILLSGPILQELRTLTDDASLRDFLHSAESKNKLLHLKVQVQTDTILDNLDTEEDYQRLLKSAGGRKDL